MLQLVLLLDYFWSILSENFLANKILNKAREIFQESWTKGLG